jgi:hypothetical protein
MAPRALKTANTVIELANVPAGIGAAGAAKLVKTIPPRPFVKVDVYVLIFPAAEETFIFLVLYPLPDLSIQEVTIAPLAGGTPVPLGSAPSNQSCSPGMYVGIEETNKDICRIEEFPVSATYILNPAVSTHIAVGELKRPLEPFTLPAFDEPTRTDTVPLGVICWMKFPFITYTLESIGLYTTEFGVCIYC